MKGMGVQLHSHRHPQDVLHTATVLRALSPGEQCLPLASVLAVNSRHFSTLLLVRRWLLDFLNILHYLSSVRFQDLSYSTGNKGREAGAADPWAPASQPYHFNACSLTSTCQHLQVRGSLCLPESAPYACVQMAEFIPLSSSLEETSIETTGSWCIHAPGLSPLGQDNFEMRFCTVAHRSKLDWPPVVYSGN